MLKRKWSLGGIHEPTGELFAVNFAEFGSVGRPRQDIDELNYFQHLILSRY